MTKQQARGLGKGLGSILGEGADISQFRSPVQYVNQTVGSGKQPSEGTVRLIPVADIRPNPFQPRISFDGQALSELAESIKALGLIQPITVRRVSDDGYQIISGERRFRACKLAGMTSVPSYIRSSDDVGMLEMAIVENVQRENLDPIETAMSYQRLIDECNLTQEAMAERIGKSRVAVTNSLRLLKLPAKVQYDVKVGNISVGHAKVLLGIEDGAVQELLSDEIIREGLSVRALEQRIRAGVARNSAKPKIQKVECDLPDEHYKVLDIIGRYFDNNVTFKRTADGKGSMTVRFASDAQMSAFLEALQNKGL